MQCSAYLLGLDIQGLESVKFNGSTKRPFKGNRINPVKLQKWVEAHRKIGEKYFLLAQFLAEHMKVFTQYEFENMLKSSIESFLKSIPGKDYSIIVNEGKLKSQFWVAQLVSELASRKPIEILIDPTTKDLEDYMQRYPDREFLFVDDASYTFESIQSGLNTTFSDFVNRTGDYMGRPGRKVNLLLAAHTSYVESILENSFINLYSTYRMPSVVELLDSVRNLKLKAKLESAFEDLYGESAFQLVITGFAHKTANHASVVGISADETYEHLKKHPEVISGRKNPYKDFGTTVLEGIIMAPDNKITDTIEILDAEKKPY